MQSPACVDLISDEEPGSGQKALGLPASACINLLSSGDDTPPKPADQPNVAATSIQAVAASNQCEASGAGQTEMPSRRTEPQAEQVRGRRPRSARTLRKVKYDDYELDFGASQSQGEGDLPLHTPKRQKVDDGYVIGLQTPDSVGPVIAAEPEPEESPLPVRKGRARLDDATRARREAEKEAKKLERLRLREAKKAEREAEKAAKKEQREQEKLARRRETGKTAIEDMTVRMDPDLAQQSTGQTIMEKLAESYAPTPPSVEQIRLPLWPLRSLTWTRTVYAPRDGDQAACSQPSSQPGSAEKQDIPYTLVCFTAAEFTSELGSDGFESVVQRAARVCPSDTLCILVEGLDHHMAQRRRKDAQAGSGSSITETDVDDFLAKICIRWPGVRVVSVLGAAQAAEHVTGLTRCLAEQPFRVEAAYVTSFGAGKPDTAQMTAVLRKAPLPQPEREVFFKMLAAIPDIGPQAALAVSSRFASLGALTAYYQAHCGSTEQKEALLQDIPQVGGQRVGPAASRKIFQILMSDNTTLCIQKQKEL